MEIFIKKPFIVRFIILLNLVWATFNVYADNSLPLVLAEISKVPQRSMWVTHDSEKI